MRPCILSHLLQSERSNHISRHLICCFSGWQAPLWAGQTGFSLACYWVVLSGIEYLVSQLKEATALFLDESICVSRRGHFSTGLLGNTLHKWNRKHKRVAREENGVLQIPLLELDCAFTDTHAALNVIDVPIKRPRSLLRNSVLSVWRSWVAWLRFRLCLCQKPHIKTFLWCTAVHLKHLPKKWWFHCFGSVP